MGLFTKKSLGVDIGASSIKVVEISSSGKKKKLENYAEFQLPVADSLKTFHTDDFLLLPEEVSALLKALLKKLNIQQKRAAFSIPDFSTFFTTFALPPMNQSEIPNAIEFEARHHIPLPLSEVMFDWQIVAKEEGPGGVKLKVLLVAVPNNVLKNYQKMAELAGLEVKGMEAEVFGLIRSSASKTRYQEPICLIDFGWQSTTVSIVMNGVLFMSHSFDISGSNIVKTLSSELKVGLEEAEELKKNYGLDPKREDIFKILTGRIDLLAVEIEKVCQDFFQLEQKEIKNLVLSGGTALLFGLKEYLASRLKKEVDIVDPFISIYSPPLLRDRLKELGPSFAVAVGVGIMGSEA